MIARALVYAGIVTGLGLVAMLWLSTPHPPASGAVLAATACGGCHSFVAGGAARVGPDLHGIADAPVASRPGYPYSAALAGLGGRWTQARMDQWLTRPRSLAPGTRMLFAGLSDPGERAAIIAYLWTLHR